MVALSSGQVKEKNRPLRSLTSDSFRLTFSVMWLTFGCNGCFFVLRIIVIGYPYRYQAKGCTIQLRPRILRPPGDIRRSQPVSRGRIQTRTIGGKGILIVETCRILTAEMLPNRVRLELENPPVDLKSARMVADQKAAEILEDPMLLAWYEKQTGRFSPQVECCGDEKPSWLVYAESRGAVLSVDIDDQDYVFVYRDVEETL